MRTVRLDSPRPPRRRAGCALVAAAALVPVLLTGCGSSKPKTPATNVASSGPANAANVTGADLSGNWNGRYGGTFSGTFKLTWTQSGDKLSGNITLSTPPGTLTINGTLNGNKISFGTVGSTAISFTGSEQQGSVMEGSYTVGGSGSGTWGATKAS